MASKLRCPACRVKFAWDPSKGFPEYCPNEACTTRIAHDRADDDVVMPFVRSTAKSRSIDNVYREMETASAHRAQQAADLAGVPVSEMSDLKITDLRPTRHEGDVAAVPVNNEVSRLIDRGVGGWQGGQGSEYGGAVSTGPFPNAGAHMRTQLQERHGRVTHGAGVSDRPANEVLQPGYRRRG